MSMYAVDCSLPKEIRGGSLRSFPVALICINYWFYFILWESNERFRDRGRFDLYTSVSWSRYPSLKSLHTSGGFYGTYFPYGRNLFFCLLKRQSLAWEDKSRRCALTKRDVLIFLEKLKLTYIHCNWIHSINVLFRWTDALYLLYIAFFKPSWFYTIYFNFISYDCQANWWFHNHVIKIKINPTFSAKYFIYVSSLLGDKLLEQHFQNGQQNAYSKHQIMPTGRQFTELLFYAQKSQNWLFFNLSYCTED